jgi:protein-tyrosine phosphatase
MRGTNRVEGLWSSWFLNSDEYMGNLAADREWLSPVSRYPHSTTPTSVDTHNSDSARTSVLFVCLGNICRSPLAEGIFDHLVREAGLDDRFDIDSAGTGAWHVGERPDARAAMVATKHGVELGSRARQITSDDLDRFDYVIAMDRENLRNVSRMVDSSDSDAEVHLLREFDEEEGDEVPDPYYGGASGFETVYEMLHRSCQTLLERLKAA